VVAYDDQGGVLVAVRLWMMLRWLGHENVAVLDGGWSKWTKESRPVKGKVETRPARTFIAKTRRDYFVSTAEVKRMRFDSTYRLVDVRLPERYTGENETIDSIGGHIPGAINIPYTMNFNDNGALRSPEELRQIYQERLDGIPANRVVFYCGSGITAIHSYLALLQAGLGEVKVYAGSWSKWIADRKRPVATEKDIV
jgi:thiosulfate/3-mercaptopyruvate sulfurtransferase